MVFKLKKASLLSKSILIGFIIVAFYIGKVVFFPHAIPNKQYQLIIEKDQSISVLATKMKEAHVISNRQAFLLLLRVMHKDKKVTAGLYNLHKSYSTWGLINRITNGNPDQISVIIRDGWSFRQLKHYIDGLENVKHLSLTMNESGLKNFLKIKNPNLEGLFYPSTYFIAPNQTDFEIYQNAYKLMQHKIIGLYESRSTNSYYKSPYQMLIMASLIQKETANITDMYLVSTVFNNRLRTGMKLQDDPAVFFGLKNKAKITRRDFQINTPYNTYIHFGLPPTPICIPSVEALKAASRPLDQKKLLFFVAIGSGKTKFSKNYEEHIGAVNKYLKKSTPVKLTIAPVIMHKAPAILNEENRTEENLENKNREREDLLEYDQENSKLNKKSAENIDEVKEDSAVIQTKSHKGHKAKKHKGGYAKS